MREKGGGGSSTMGVPFLSNRGSSLREKVSYVVRCFARSGLTIQGHGKGRGPGGTGDQRGSNRVVCRPIAHDTPREDTAGGALSLDATRHLRGGRPSVVEGLFAFPSEQMGRALEKGPPSCGLNRIPT